MSKTTAYAGALAAALLVATAGAAAAQSGEIAESSSGSGSDSGALSASAETGDGDQNGSDAEGPGSVGELAPASVTGSLPGYATGPLGSTATLACNVGSAAGLAATATGMPLPIPIGGICAVVNPLAASGDALLGGDVRGSVDAVIGGIPVVGGSVTKNVDTSSVAEQVEDLVGDRLGSLAESSLSPDN
ncbi:MAG TPA: hypothetical protein H9755_09360 [Candidatus Dietzia intestinigallinarum]|nr:hypothetical protein [Candidatus Dietzia intestinigallinarum]